LGDSILRKGNPREETKPLSLERLKGKNTAEGEGLKASPGTDLLLGETLRERRKKRESQIKK